MEENVNQTEKEMAENEKEEKQEVRAESRKLTRQFTVTVSN